MEAEEAAPLFQRIITKTKFEDNVDEITFAAPVCLTGIAVGAMPGATPEGGHAFLNVFARDSRACGSARFACLYEGIQQPTVGVAAVHIQPFVTDHVVLRGRYQTAPITLLGVPLSEAASQYVPRPETPQLDLDQALSRFQNIVESLPEEEPSNSVSNEQQEGSGEENAAENIEKFSAEISFSKDAWPALQGLLKFWAKVGSSYRKISECTVPAAAFKAAVKAADNICEKLASSGSSCSISILNDADDSKDDDYIDDAELINMAMGWCGLLADIPIPLATASPIFECATAGIAAMVLVSTQSSAATALLARHGQVLLATVLKSPTAPGSQLRHATGACLLLALTNGAAGCEALLGWWNPSFIQWAAPAKKQPLVTETERRPRHREDRSEKLKVSEGGKGEKRKDAEREIKPETATTAAVSDPAPGVKIKKEEDVSKDAKEPVEEKIKEEKPRRRRGGAPIPSLKTIPQVDGAGDERRHKNYNNKRQKRDGSNTRDQQQQQRGNTVCGGGGGGNRRQNRGGGGSGDHRDFSRQVVEDDDRWDGGGSAEFDFEEAEMWQPEEYEEEEYDKRDAREERNVEEEPRRRGRDHKHDEKKELDRRPGRSVSNERNREHSRDRLRRDEPRRRSRDRQQQQEKEERRGGRKEENAGRSMSRERLRKDLVEMQRQQQEREGRGRKEEFMERKLDHRQHERKERSREPAPAPPPPPPPPPRVPRPIPPSAAADAPGSHARGATTSHLPATDHPKPGKGGKKEQEDVAILHKFTYFWDDRRRHYVGVYSSLATVLLQIQPRTLTTLGTRLMRLLRFYEHVTLFSKYAEDLTSQYLPSKRSSMMGQEAVALAAKCGSALAHIAEYLALGDLNPPGDRLKSCTRDSSEYSSVEYKKRGLHPVFVELLKSRRVFSFLPALVLVPATHKARSEEEGGDAATTAGASSAAMSNQLALGLRPFLSALTSTAAGLKALTSVPGVVSELLRVLRLPSVLDTSLSSAIAPLGDLVVAVVAVEDLSTCSLSSSKFASAAATLGQLLSSGPSQRIPTVHAVCLSANEALPKLVNAVMQRCDVLFEAAGMPSLRNKNQDDEVDGDAFGRVLDSLPSLEICTDILLAVLKECTSSSVVFSLAPLTATLLPPLSVAAENLCGCPAPGAATLYTAVESICGGFEALSTFNTSSISNNTHSTEETTKTNVVKALVAALDSDLPPLAPVSFENFLSSSASGIELDEENNDGSGSVYVEWSDIREFWDNPRGKYRSEVELKILTMLMWEPTHTSSDDTGSFASNLIVSGRNAAAEMQYNDGQRIVLRALLTAGEAVTASHADRQWVSRTGAAIDPASAASNKHAALEFLSSVAATASAFFQHMRGVMSVKSTACAAALLEAHAAISSEEDCLLALMSQSGAAACGTAALTARYHLTSALRCWIECSTSSSSSSSSPWTPALLPLILFGTKHAKRVKHHGESALPPRQLFSAACLLGDLAPAEWPPAGIRRLANPPPSHRLYRIAFAKAIERNEKQFGLLISACVEGESTLLRASAARMLARAAGFGGGMGPFIVKPIVAALQARAASQTPAHDVRKVLELLVPLVYRPALKAALLDTNAPAILAEILRVMVTGVPLGSTTPVPIDPSDGSAICTMALECLVVLCNPEHMLDPQASPEQLAFEDVPSISQGIIIVSSLLDILAYMGVNVPLGHRVLRLLAETVPGRIALRRAAAASHAKSKGALNDSTTPMPQEIVAAAQWVATRYWTASQHAQHDQASASNADALADVSKIMKEICMTMDADSMIGGIPKARDASTRFQAATEKAISAALSAGGDLAMTEHRWDKGIPDPITIPESFTTVNAAGDLAVASGVFDPVTRMFWKNYRARAVQQTPESAVKVLKKYVRWVCLPDEHFTLADTLHLPLTRPLRPLKEDMEADQEADEQDMGDGDVGTLQAGGQEGVKQEELGAMAVIPPPDATKTENEAVPVVAPVIAPILPHSVVPVIAPSSVPAADFDLYADLGADLGTTVAATAAVAVEKAALIAEPARMDVDEHTTKIEESIKQEKTASAAVISPRKEMAASPKAISADDPAALLNDPAAIAALLKDPVKMQELLQRNPALHVALKSKLGK